MQMGFVQPSILMHPPKAHGFGEIAPLSKMAGPVQASCSAHAAAVSGAPRSVALGVESVPQPTANMTPIARRAKPAKQIPDLIPLAHPLRF